METSSGKSLGPRLEPLKPVVRGCFVAVLRSSGPASLAAGASAEFAPVLLLFFFFGVLALITGFEVAFLRKTEVGNIAGGGAELNTWMLPLVDVDACVVIGPSEEVIAVAVVDATAVSGAVGATGQKLVVAVGVEKMFSAEFESGRRGGVS